MLRPGNAGSNTATDHIAVPTEALAQIPAWHRRDGLITVDGAGATLELIRHLTGLDAVPGRRVGYFVGFDVDERARSVITRVPATAWQAVWDTDGRAGDLDDAGVVELTGGATELRRQGPDGQLAGRDAHHLPAGTPSAGAQLCLLEEADGWRYQLIATNTPSGQPVFLQGPAPPPRPGRRPDPLREGHRPKAPALDVV